MESRLALALTALALVTIAPTADGQRTGELRFMLSNIDSSRGGHVRCALYDSAETWLNRSRAKQRDSVPANSSTVTCVFENVRAGTYGLAALHDADDDRQMDQNLIGIPEEGYAISNNETPRLSAPDFDQAHIHFDGTRKTVRARMEY